VVRDTGEIQDDVQGTLFHDPANRLGFSVVNRIYDTVRGLHPSPDAGCTRISQRLAILGYRGKKSIQSPHIQRETRETSYLVEADPIHPPVFFVETVVGFLDEEVGATTAGVRKRRDDAVDVDD